MTFDVAKRFADLILGDNDYIPKDAPGIIFDFIGGEPTLQIDLIDQIADYITMKMIKEHHKWSNRFCFSMCSNGVLYFDPKV